VLHDRLRFTINNLSYYSSILDSSISQPLPVAIITCHTHRTLPLFTVHWSLCAIKPLLLHNFFSFFPFLYISPPYQHLEETSLRRSRQKTQNVFVIRDNGVLGLAPALCYWKSRASDYHPFQLLWSWVKIFATWPSDVIEDCLWIFLFPQANVCIVFRVYGSMHLQSLK